MAKKYYWLKLQKDFFKRHDIRIVETMPNGKDYVLFYLKLLVESISHEGRLRFSESIPYEVDMLSTITNTNIDIVRTAVKVFTELGLMEIFDDGTIYLRETKVLLGAETEWADKKRSYRDRKQLEDKKEDIVLLMSDKSKSKSLEIEKKSTRFTPDFSFICNEEIKPIFEKWCKGKSKKYKNQIQVESGYNKLYKLSSGNKDDAFEIVEYSLSGNYDGLFPLKGKENSAKPKSTKVLEQWTCKHGGTGTPTEVLGKQCKICGDVNVRQNKDI